MVRALVGVMMLLLGALHHAAPALAATSTYRVLHVFQGHPGDGATPLGALLNVGGLLYGTTADGGAHGLGTAFTLDPATGAYKVVYSFKGSPNDGEHPYAGLIDVGGILYGTTYTGGSANGGTVFSLDPAGGPPTILHSFTDAPDAALPQAGLLSLGGKLYGTTIYGGGNGSAYGALFSVDRKSRTERVLQSFDSLPTSSLLRVGTTLFGTVTEPSAVFSFDMKTGALKFPYFLGGAVDNFLPGPGLIAVNGTLFAVGVSGGSTGCQHSYYSGCGIIVALDPQATAGRVVYAFQGGDDGSNPAATLLNFRGLLYGVTYHGGTGKNCADGGQVRPSECGTVFSVNPATGVEKVRHSFEGGSDGQNPISALITVGNVIYGTTSRGGGSSACEQGCGTIFAFTPP